MAPPGGTKWDRRATKRRYDHRLQRFWRPATFIGIRRVPRNLRKQKPQPARTHLLRAHSPGSFADQAGVAVPLPSQVPRIRPTPLCAAVDAAPTSRTRSSAVAGVHPAPTASADSVALTSARSTPVTAAMSPWPHITALFTDLYEITMAQAYVAERMSGTAVFETLLRKLPDGR